MNATISPLTNGYICGDDMQTSLPDVYAAGDCAECVDVTTGERQSVALWPNAVAQGTVAGTNMAGCSMRCDDTLPMNAVTLFETSILSCGQHTIPKETEEGEIYATFAFDAENMHRRFYTHGKRLVGFTLVNSPENAGIYASLIRNKITLDDISKEAFKRPVQVLDLADGLRKRYRKGIEGLTA